jgi:hypothetical protein
VWAAGGNYAAVENPVTGMATVDNYYLSLALESGLPAMLLFILILWTFIRRSRRMAAIPGNFCGRVAECFSLSFIGFAVFCMILSIYEIFTLVFVLFGILLVMERDMSQDALLVAKKNEVRC